MKAPKQVIDPMLTAESIGSRIKFLQVERKENIDAIEAELNEKSAEEFIYDDGEEKILVAMLSERTTISWDLDVLRKRLPRSVLKQVVRFSVDPEKLQSAYESGLIPLSVMRRASSVSTSKSVLVHRRSRD